MLAFSGLHDIVFGRIGELQQASTAYVTGCIDDPFNRYGFYGDVMRESEELRWMGPARYDLAGFKVFMNHK